MICGTGAQSKAATREANLKTAAEVMQKIDEMWLNIARASAPLNSTLDEFIDSLTQAIFSESVRGNAPIHRPTPNH